MVWGRPALGEAETKHDGGWRRGEGRQKCLILCRLGEQVLLECDKLLKVSWSLGVRGGGGHAVTPPMLLLQLQNLACVCWGVCGGAGGSTTRLNASELNGDGGVWPRAERLVVCQLGYPHYTPCRGAPGKPKKALGLPSRYPDLASNAATDAWTGLMGLWAWRTAPRGASRPGEHPTLAFRCSLAQMPPPPRALVHPSVQVSAPPLAQVTPWPWP